MKIYNKYYSNNNYLLQQFVVVVTFFASAQHTVCVYCESEVCVLFVT